MLLPKSGLAQLALALDLVALRQAAQPGSQPEALAGAAAGKHADSGDHRGIGQSDSATWLGLVHAELLYREGDTVSAGRICAGLLAQLEEKQSSWWYGVQAVIQARLALIALADGDEAPQRAQRSGRAARDLFADYLTSRGHADPDVVALFDRLYGEVAH